MLLYERFKNEAEFREKFVKPLLNRLGFYDVSEPHGSQEFGKDFVFSELHRLGGMRHYAAQVKHKAKINQGSSVDALLTQVRQAFAKPFTRADSPRECHVSAVYVFNSGQITANAKDQLLNELGPGALRGERGIFSTVSVSTRSTNGRHCRVTQMQGHDWSASVWLSNLISEFLERITLTAQRSTFWSRSRCSFQG